MRLPIFLNNLVLTSSIVITLLKRDRNITPSKTYRRIANHIQGIPRTINNTYSSPSICNRILVLIENYVDDKGQYKCCGLDVYQKNKQTCCLTTSSEYKVHENKKERDHICCGLDVYARRSSNAPCQHVSRNDAFLSSKLPKLETNYLDHSTTKKLISGKTYAFFVRLVKEKKIKKKRFLVAIITQYRRRMNEPATMRRVRRKIPLDQYSLKRVKRKEFVIFSDHEYFEDRDFVRRHGDTVFKAPKRKLMFLRRLRKLYGTCKT